MTLHRVVVVTILVTALARVSIEGRADDRLRFNRDIRPILADNCFPCHGPDSAKRQAELRLDVQDQAIASGAIRPGDAMASGLVARVLSDNPDEIMPPPAANKILTAVQKDILRRWIEEGAEYEGHWAFVAPVRPPVPELPAGFDRAAAPTNPIDAFVGVALVKAGLEPSPEASRETLIRRVSLDLTGLPPSPEEIEAFLADASPNAWERVVDRLLDSPRYGERMAVSWLDSARYADSNGFQTDSSRQMWRWRDWVINAFNRNLPFDQFTIQQLAGDLLPSPDNDQLIATGFHRNTKLNGEGGRIAEEWFAETVIDRVETTGQTWMALTIGCCRCHDHKFDPMTQRDFYSLYAFFNSVDESGVLDSEGGGRGGGNSRPVLPVPTTEDLQMQQSLQEAISRAALEVEAAESRLPELQSAWEAEMAAANANQIAVWQLFEPQTIVSSGGATLSRLDDASWLASGTNAASETYTLSAPAAAGEFSAIRITSLPDPSLPGGSLGRAFNGNFVLTGVEAEITSPDRTDPLPVVFARAEASYEQSGYEARLLVSGSADAQPRRGWAVDGNDPAKRLPRQIMLVSAEPVTIPANAQLTIRLKHESQFAQHSIGRFRLEISGRSPGLVQLTDEGLPDSIRSIIRTSSTDRTEQQQQELAAYFRDHADNPLTKARAELTAARQKLTDFNDTLPTTMIMKELPQPRQAFVLKRGQYDQPGDSVDRRVPAALPGLPEGAPVNRLGLAQWLMSPDHPLTARVWVNRQWERFFGTGLVKTTDNFGLQSEPPVHPELLDWLACEFVGNGWDMKAMQKLMVMSATYRQSSHVTALQLERDPENRLLSRASRVRLPAEVIRDQALAISGLLHEQIGGPSVRPYMPDGVWDETSKYGDLRGYKHDQGTALYRRTLYTIWKRTAAPPTMLMFDSPSREVCTVRRSRTNTPLQALSLLNEVTYVEAARVLAEHMMTSGGPTAADRIRWGFRRATGRWPDITELAVLSDGFERHRGRFQDDTEQARRLIATGDAPAHSDFDPRELAAWTLTANVLLNLDEVVTRE